jgi:hypothetical protein
LVKEFGIKKQQFRTCRAEVLFKAAAVGKKLSGCGMGIIKKQSPP